MDETIQIESQTYILTSSSRVDNRTRVLKKNDTFLVSDWNGEIGQVGTSSLGLYLNGTRHLSKWAFKIEGGRPMPLNSTISEDNRMLVVDQTTPDIIQDNKPIIPKGTLHVRRKINVQDGEMLEKLCITNYAAQSIRLEFSYRFAADYQDIFEVRGVHRKQKGQLLPAEQQQDKIILSYQGLDTFNRQTQLQFTLEPNFLDQNEAKFSIEILANQEFTLETQVLAQSDETNFIPTDGQNNCHSSATQITTDNEQFNEWIDRSISDLKMLTSQTEYGIYPYAGVPWFATPFGRDGIIAALQTLWLEPSLAKGVLNYLAATQSKTTNASKEAQPGKIMHETRKGEMAKLGEIPFDMYYGTIDATPLFVVLAGRYFLRTNDINFIESIWSNICAAIQWMEDYGDIDDDGFLEYQRSTDTGLVQQGWKDSFDSIFHTDTSDAKMPIALCEVQAYAYEAYELGAMLAEKLQQTNLKQAWENKKSVLKTQFNQQFWDEELGTYVIALDGDKKPCRVKSSNAGHALYSGIADKDKATKVAKSLVSIEAFNGWGLRTIYRGEARYNPMSYHNGSIWPHDTSMAAYGLGRYGFKQEAMLYLNGLFEASHYFELSRLPELFCGFTRVPGQAPTNYPVACIPQAWAAGSIFMMLEAILGMEFTEDQTISLKKPKLPHNVNYMKISNLGYGTNTVDLILNRRGSDVALHTENRRGDINIIVLV